MLLLVLFFSFFFGISVLEVSTNLLSKSLILSSAVFHSCSTFEESVKDSLHLPGSFHFLAFSLDSFLEFLSFWLHYLSFLRY